MIILTDDETEDLADHVRDFVSMTCNMDLDDDKQRAQILHSQEFSEVHSLVSFYSKLQGAWQK